MVTLTGSGGCGKTRLAVEVAGDVASRFSDEACWVDLQGVNGLRLVAPAIGRAVGRHLDGIPLAIELAATRVRVLAPGQIAWHVRRSGGRAGST